MAQRNTPPETSHVPDDPALFELASNIKQWARELGFQQAGISGIDPGIHLQHLDDWLAKNYHGEMQWMQARRDLRADPKALEPYVERIISVRMDYWPGGEARNLLDHPDKAYIARYALGRDYHKTLRKRLARLGERIREAAAECQYRAFVDSAPVLEKSYAEQAGLGWIGKHTLLLNREAGSWFFLGELFTNLPLPVDAPVSAHCGSCSACMEICPTRAIVAPYQLDARKCISYLTIEYDGPIPEDLRKPMGNRIFGCDDCQIVCPWNKFARQTREPDFLPRHSLDNIRLLQLLAWDETTFLDNTAGSPLRRIGYWRWLRNLAVALGNADYNPDIIVALQAKLQEKPLPEMIAEHLHWAIRQQQQKSGHSPNQSTTARRKPALRK